MADIRISALPNEPTPSASDFVAVDLASTRKTTVQLLTEAGRPTASQAEAEAGVQASHAMTPLTTAQAISFQGAAAYVPLARTLTAGAGLLGGGDLTINRSFSVDYTQVQPFSTKLSNIDGVTFTGGSFLIATGANTFTSLAAGSANQVLQIIAGTPTWTNVSAGGDVTGPASAVTGSIPTFNGTTGKIIQAGNPTMADFLAASTGPLPTIANDVTDAVNDIVFSAGAAFSSDATNWPMVGASRIKQLDAAWAVGTNAGGRMSAAAIANTTYYCYQIRRPDTGVVDYGFDVSATAPTLPTNYTQYRRIGAIIRSAGSIIAFTQTGDTFIKTTTTSDLNAAIVVTTGVLQTLAVPVGIKVEALYRGILSNGTTVSASSVLITSPDEADVATNSPAGNLTCQVPVVGIPIAFVGRTLTNTSGQIRYRTGNATSTLQIATLGWVDARGR